MDGSARERGFERFITFLDAIVAIAITLLVLPLVELTADVDRYGSVRELLGENRAELGAFVLSFLVVSRFWFVQHDSARHLRRYDRRVAGMLMLWALTIVFLPFPTALVAESSGDGATKVLYVGTLICSVLLIAIVEFYLRRHPELTDGDPEGDLDPVDGIASITALLLALAIMLTTPATSYFPLLLLLASAPAAAGWRKIRRRHH